MALEGREQPLQHLLRDLLGRLIELHHHEAALKGLVPALHDLLVFGRGCGPDASELSSGKRRLEEVRRIHAAALLRLACPQGHVDLVDEEDDLVSSVVDLFQQALHALLELATIPRAPHQGSQAELDQLLAPLELARHAPLVHPASYLLYHGGLADAGLAKKADVRLVPPREHPEDTIHLLVSSEHRVQLALSRRCHQIPPKALKRWRLVVLLVLPAGSERPEGVCALVPVPRAALGVRSGPRGGARGPVSRPAGRRGVVSVQASQRACQARLREAVLLEQLGETDRGLEQRAAEVLELHRPRLVGALRGGGPQQLRQAAALLVPLARALPSGRSFPQIRHRRRDVGAPRRGRA
mmetsp:Transcript_8302/g.22546  ORF Transcript_8302/g.22546 Transcript_8302/m.22546 type:complete len:354 (+) Transcript_8302:475-1536(+)